MPKNRSVDSSNQARIWYLVLLVLGTLSWALTMVKSGLPSKYGLGFWGANGHDGIWHLALAGQLAKGHYVMPVFAGVPLHNYHIGFDLLLASLHRLTSLSLVTLYFQVLPPLLAFAIGVLTHRFVVAWRKSWYAANWAVFFVYFGGSFGWLVNLFHGQLAGGESMFWAQQAVSTLINPPFALSLVLLLIGLLALQKYLVKPNLISYISSVVVLGILIQVKVYAGLLVLAGLVLAGVFDFLRRRTLRLLKIFVGVFAVLLALFISTLKTGTSLIVFQPFWFLENMMGLSDRLNWPRFFSAMVNYRLAGNWLKAALAYTVAFFIFWYGNFGTRLFSEYFAYRVVVKKRADALSVMLYTIVIAGGVVPLFFLQTGTPWNTIQFLYYSLFFGGILAGVAVADVVGTKWESVKLLGSKVSALGIAVIVLTMPTTLLTLHEVYLPARPPASLPADELAALKFLSEQPEGVVLTYPFDKTKAEAAIANPPRPLFLYDSTAYVSAFSGKQTFLEDEVNLTITNYEWQGRRSAIEQFYVETDQGLARKFLQDNRIKYVYWVDGQRALLGESQLGLTKIYENSSVNVFEVE